MGATSWLLHGGVPKSGCLSGQGRQRGPTSPGSPGLIQTPILPTPVPQAPKTPHTFRPRPSATLSVPGGAACAMGKGGHVAADSSETGQNLR